MKEQFLYIIVNPFSGKGKKGGQWPAIERILLKQNINYHVEWTKKKNHAIILAKKAIEMGHRTIISVGGDGTHNEVVNGIMLQKVVSSNKIKFGVISNGTGNDWIRTHKIPKNFKQCVSLINKGKTSFQDVGLLSFGTKNKEKRYFINAAGFGYDAFLVKELAKSNAHKSSSFVYMMSILKNLFKYQAEKIHLLYNDISIVDHFYTINACLGKYAGGGLVIAPHAKQNDGMLAMTLAYKMSKLVILFNLYRFYTGTIDKHRKIDTFHTKIIHLTNPEGAVSVEVDGEYLGKHKVKINVIPSALQLIC